MRPEMILPIYSYGNKVLRQKAADIPADYPGLKQLIADMFETMYNAHGVGLAAPQIGEDIRLFVIDAESMDPEKLKGAKMVFVNAQMIEEDGPTWAYEEGCLSIPGIRAEVARKERIRIKYLDETLTPQEKSFDGLLARVIQHEYDHIDGVLFTDYLTPLKKRLLMGKLTAISKGNCDADYRMRFALK